ncbi:MAG: glycosyltransferase family 4 protein [Alistipes sp.]|nr:glycosyltransferase family 4 protein [Alistipes sp.]
MKELYIVVNVDHFLLSHRLPVALAATKDYRVTIVTKDTGHRKEIESYGLNFIDIPFERANAGILHELKCLFKLYKIYRKAPDPVLHHVTMKAIVFGSIAARLAGRKKVVNAVSGFGQSLEQTGGFKSKVARKAVLFSLKYRNNRFILQNQDDIRLLESLGITSAKFLIKGSGVDLNEFSCHPETVKEKVRVVMCARMVTTKGVVEFINAAKKIKPFVGEKTEFILAGTCDTVNPNGIQEEELRKMLDDPYIKWLGHVKDVNKLLRDSDIVVLPSYREGLPKSLIEGCAVGRPIITTNTTGCRECVIEDHNGYLVPVRDVDLLADRMRELIEDKDKRAQFGRNSRVLAEKQFSIEDVIEAHLKIYHEMDPD